MIEFIKSKRFNNIIITIMSVGVFSTFRPIMVIALLLWICKCSIECSWGNVKEFFNEDIIKKTVLFLGLYFGFLLADHILLLDKSGFKQTLHFLERMLPGTVFFFMIYKQEKILKPCFLGMFFGILFITSTAFYGHFVLNEVRTNSYLGNPNNLGGWIVVSMPMFIALGYKHKKDIGCLLATLLGFVMLITSLYFSNSRGAIFACFVIVLVMIFLYIPRKVKLGLLFMTLICFSSVAVLNIHNLIYEKAYNNQNNMVIHGRSDMERIYLLQSGWNMFKDHIVTGVGADNYSKEYVNNYMHPNAVNKKLNSPHNFVLHYLDYYGVLGSLGLWALIIGWFKVQIFWIYNQMRNDCVAIGMFLTTIGFLTHAMVDNIHLTSFAMQIVGFLWALMCYWEIAHMGKRK